MSQTHVGLGAAVVAALATTVIAVSVAPAQGDSLTCVSRPEFDNTTYGESVNQIANRFDVYGVYLDDTASRFRRGYKTCWAPASRQAVVVFSYSSGGSVDWYVRDI